MAKQIFKKRGGGSNTGESTFETSDEKTEVPEVDGVMQQIDKSLADTEHVKVEEIEFIQHEPIRIGCCFSRYEDD